MAAKKMERRIMVSFTDVYFRADRNYGRIVSQHSSDAKLNQLKELIRNSGLDGTKQTMTVVDGREQDIVDEMYRRQELIDGLTAKVTVKMKPTDIEVCMLDVANHYFATKAGKIKSPKHWQITGNQRGDVYLPAMAERLQLVRSKGFAAIGMEQPSGIDAATAPASAVCQEEYQVLHAGLLSDREIRREQRLENTTSAGNEQPTSVDLAASVFADVIEDGFVPAESVIMAENSIKRGQAQHVHRMATVAWLLRDKLDIFANARKPVNAPAMTRDNPDGYANPAAWASGMYDSDRPKMLVKLLDRMDSDKLNKINKLRSADGEQPLSPATIDDLYSFVMDAPTGRLSAEAVKWSAAEEHASKQCTLLGSFIAACRKGQVALDRWTTDNSRILHNLKKIETDAKFRSDIAGVTGDTPDSLKTVVSTPPTPVSIGSDASDDDSNELT